MRIEPGTPQYIALSAAVKHFEQNNDAQDVYEWIGESMEEDYNEPVNFGDERDNIALVKQGDLFKHYHQASVRISKGKALEAFNDKTDLSDVQAICWFLDGMFEPAMEDHISDNWLSDEQAAALQDAAYLLHTIARQIMDNTLNVKTLLMSDERVLRIAGIQLAATLDKSPTTTV